MATQQRTTIKVELDPDIPHHHIIEARGMGELKERLIDMLDALTGTQNLDPGEAHPAQEMYLILETWADAIGCRLILTQQQRPTGRPAVVTPEEALDFIATGNYYQKVKQAREEGVGKRRRGAGPKGGNKLIEDERIHNIEDAVNAPPPREDELEPFGDEEPQENAQ